MTERGWTKDSAESKTRAAEERNSPVETAEDDGGRPTQMYRIPVGDIDSGREWKLSRMSFVLRDRHSSVTCSLI